MSMLSKHPECRNVPNKELVRLGREIGRSFPDKMYIGEVMVKMGFPTKEAADEFASKTLGKLAHIMRTRYGKSIKPKGA